MDLTFLQNYILIDKNMQPEIPADLNKKNILVYSSFVFLTNVLFTLYRQYYIYSFLFLCLTITSVSYHSTSNSYINILDKFFIGLIVLYGGYILYHKINQNPVQLFIIILTFLFVCFLYFYGYMVNDYCYHTNSSLAKMYHCILHLVSSLGHHLIIL